MAKRLCFLALGILLICPMSYGAESFPFLGETNANRVNLRAGRSQNYERLDLLKQGEELVVVGKSYSWYKVRLSPEVNVYVSADYVKMRAGQIAEVTGNRVNVRAGAGSQFNSLGQLKKGYLIRVKKKTDGWYAIEPPQHIYGWIADKYVAFKSNTIPPSKMAVDPNRSIYPTKSLLKPADNSVDEPVSKLNPQIESELKRQPEPESKQQYIPAKEAPPVTDPVATSLDFESGPFTVIGEVSLLEKSPPHPSINHKLIGEDGTVYYLKGHRAVLNGYAGFKVKVNGLLNKDTGSKFRYPVIAVTKLYLVL